MDRCSNCGSILPLYAQFCGQCGTLISDVRGGIGSSPAATILADDQPTTISNPSHPVLNNYGGQGNAATSLPWSQGGATQPTPNTSDDEENERRRRALLLGLPLLGAIADQPPAANVPMVQGTPPLSGIPMVHGNPSLAQNFQNVASIPSPQYGPAAPHTPLPNAGPWPPTHSHTPPPSGHRGPGSSGHTPTPGGPPCGVLVLIIAIICMIIVGTIGGLFFGLPPAISISGSADVTSGGVLHLHGNNFVPGSSVTLTLDNTIPLFAAAGTTPAVTSHAASAALPMSLVGQFTPANTHITAAGNGTFDVNIPVSTNWSHGQHTIRAREDISSRSAVINFIIDAPAAKLIVKPSDIDFGKIEKGSKPVMSVVVNNGGGNLLSWQASSGDAKWVRLQPASGNIQTLASPQFIYVTADTSQLKVGVYTATLHITSNGGNSLVNVRLEVVPPSPKPVAKINVTPNSLDFGSMDTGTQLSRTVTISNSGTLALNWKADTANASWIALDTKSQTIQPGARPNTIKVTVDTTNLTSGPQSAVLNIASNGGNVQVTIKVVVNSPQTTQPCTLLAPSISSESFSAQIGSNPKPASQNFTIGITGNCVGSVTIIPTVTMATGTNWLAATPSTISITSGSTTFSVNVTSSTLALGKYTGSISLAAANGGTPISGSPQIVTITLNVTETPPVLAINPSALSFDLSNGDKATSKPFQIANTGGAPLKWTPTLVAPSFVSISSPSGTNLAAGTSATESVTVNPVEVQAGTYSATVTIDAVDPLTGNVVTGSPAKLTVTITITQPPSMLLSTQSLTLTPPNCVYTASDTVTITNSGGGSLGWNVADPVYTNGQPTGWLSVSPSGQGSGDITLKFSADGTGSKLQFGLTYTATVTITPSAGNQQTVTVSFTISCLG
jgi:Flagellar-associated PapD-like